MPTIAVRHKAGDINAWLKGHQNRVKIFALAITGFKSFQDTADPNTVTLVIEATDVALPRSIINDPKNNGLRPENVNSCKYQD